MKKIGKQKVFEIHFKLETNVQAEIMSFTVGKIEASEVIGVLT